MAYAHYRDITIDHNLCGSADSTDWVLTFDTTAVWLKTVANGGNVRHSSGYDIAFYDSTGATQLDHKIIRYDGTAGRLVARVKIPTLSASTDTRIRVYYDDASISSSQEDQAGTFANGFLAYYPLGDGSTLDVVDHTGNGYTLTNNGTWGAAAGQVDGGTAESDGTSQYLSDSTMASPDSITISWWQYIDTGDASTDCLFYFRGGSSSSQRLFVHAPYVDHVIYWDYGNNTVGNGRVTTSYSGKYDAWVHVACVYDDNTGLHAIYLNGTLAASHTQIVSNPTLSSGVFINACNDGPSFYGKRNLDELTIANAGRSTSWIKAEYENQLSPTTFYLITEPEVFDRDVFDGGTFDVGTLTGSAAQTLGAVTQSAAGSLSLNATASQTLGAVTQAAAATLEITAAAAQTLGAVTQSAEGMVANAITGDAAQTLGAVTQAAAATLEITAAAAQTLSAVTQSAAGSLTINATASQTLGDVTQAADGVVTNAITGDAAQTLGAVTQSAAATLALSGSAAQALGAVTQAANGSQNTAQFHVVRWTRQRFRSMEFSEATLQ